MDPAERREELADIRRRLVRLAAVQEMVTDDMRHLLDEVEELAEKLPLDEPALGALLRDEPYSAGAATGTGVDGHAAHTRPRGHLGRGLARSAAPPNPAPEPHSRSVQ